MSAQTGWRSIRGPLLGRRSLVLGGAGAFFGLAAIVMVGVRQGTQPNDEITVSDAAVQTTTPANVPASSSSQRLTYFLVTASDLEAVELMASSNPFMTGQMVAVNTPEETTAFMDGIRDASRIRAGMGLTEIDVVDLRVGR